MMAQKWLFRLWQLVVGLLLLASVGYGVFDSTHSLWAVAFVLGVILVAALLLRNCLNPSHTSYHFFEDDSTCGLHAWKATPEWSVLPPREGESGIQLVYHHHLSGVLLLKTYRTFVDGVIECQICLKPGAMFSLLPRGSLEEDDFCLARLEERRAVHCFLALQNRSEPPDSPDTGAGRSPRAGESGEPNVRAASRGRAGL